MKCPKCNKETLRLWGIDDVKPVCPDCYRASGNPTLRDLNNKRKVTKIKEDMR